MGFVERNRHGERAKLGPPGVEIDVEHLVDAGAVEPATKPLVGPTAEPAVQFAGEFGCGVGLCFARRDVRKGAYAGDDSIVRWIRGGRVEWKGREYRV